MKSTFVGFSSAANPAKEQRNKSPRIRALSDLTNGSVACQARADESSRGRSVTFFNQTATDIGLIGCSLPCYDSADAPLRLCCGRSAPRCRPSRPFGRSTRSKRSAGHSRESRRRAAADRRLRGRDGGQGDRVRRRRRRFVSRLSPARRSRGLHVGGHLPARQAEGLTSSASFTCRSWDPRRGCCSRRVWSGAAGISTRSPAPANRRR